MVMSNRTSCIQHVPGSSFVKLHADYLKICDGNHCAAIILSVMENWHNTKLANQGQAETENRQAENEGLPASSNPELWVYMSYDQFGESLMGLFGETKIAAAVKLLISKGFL